MLTMKGLPRLLVRAGRLLGFRMRLTPLTERRVRRFKSIRRGFWCFALVCTAFVLSLFLELIANDRALYVRFGDRVQMPAVAEWLNAWVPFVKLDEVARRKDFGLPGDAELDYRAWARWVRDPATLEEDAAAVEAWIAKDEADFRDKLGKAARERGEAFDPALPLPDFKEHEYEAKRAEAARLRALRVEFDAGKAGVLLTLHPYSATEQLLSLPGIPPHPAFRAGLPLLGTDAQGRDVLSQLLYGFRLSFAFAIVVSLIGYVIGVAVGAIMGYFGGWIDIGVQRFIEVWSAIPFLFVLMIVGNIVSPSFWVLAVMLVVLSAWVGITFTVRGEFYREKARDYVQAAVAIGVRSPKIIGRHILPNSLVPVVTFLPFEIVANIDVLVSLDFLGFGLPPGTPSWGGLLRQGAENISNHPELVYFPVLALAVTLFCVVSIGEAVREAFDPKTYSRLR
jgi:microcin C transport system permease protein